MDAQGRSRVLRRSLALLPMLVVLAFRLAGPEDLDDNDQAKQALYAFDVRANANWILPQERGVLPASKPPLYAWLAAATSVPFGASSELGVRLPSVLASLALVLLLYALTEERFGERAALYAAWLYACTHTAVNLSVHVRPDPLLALLCGASLFALHRAELGRPRGMAPLFWISSALSVLAKGPVGLLVPLGGALALLGSAERRAALGRVLASRWALALAVPIAWGGLAYLVGGSQYVTDTVLGETVDRALGIGTRAGRPGAIPGQLIGHFLVKGLPVSLLALPALARICTRAGRSTDPLLLLPCGAFALGVALLSLSHGQRQDYLLPFLAPAAVAAGAVLAEASRGVRTLWIGLLCVATALPLAGGGLALAGSGPAALVPLGVAWGAILVGAGALLALVARSALRDARAPRIRHVAGGIAALLLLECVYNDVFSHVARAGRDRDVRDFAEQVREIATPLDRLRIAAGVRGSVFFFLGHNESAVSEQELGAYDAWVAPGGRFLLVANAAERRDLDALFPGRFKLLAQKSFARTSEGLVLLEDASARGTL